MKTFYLILVAAFVFLFVIESDAQTLTVYSIDPSNYPYIKAEFKLRDTNNAEIRNFNTSDIEVYENAVKRVVQSISCGPQDKSKFSAILTIDMSKSMDSLMSYNPPSAFSRLEAAKNAAKAFINNLPVDRFECAITVFSSGTYLKHDFSTDKNSLRDSVNSIVTGGGTNYNAGLMRDNAGNPGALEIAKKAKYKPIIIFLMDGDHNEQFSGGPFRSWDVINEANTINASIFVITLGLMMPPELAMVCSQTGGDSYSNITDTTKIVETYLKILNDAGNMGLYPPCELVWQTDCKGGTAKLKLTGINSKDTVITYTIPDSVKTYLDVNPRTVSFVNVKPSANNEIPVTITARKSFVDINGANCSDNRFNITDWGGTIPPFRIEKDQSRTIKVKYTATDSSYIPVNFIIDGSACNGLTFNPVSEWVITPEIDMGTALVNSKTQLTIQAVTNKTGDGLSISKVNIINDPAGDFSIVSTNIPQIIQDNNTLDLIFEFHPTTEGKKQANFVIETNKGVFSTVIMGKGAESSNVNEELMNKAAITSITPNPANGNVEVKFETYEEGKTSLIIHDILGNKVVTIAESVFPQGSNNVDFDANLLPDGIYYITMQTSTRFITQKIEIVK